MKVIGLDVGERRIGVAQANTDTRIAVPAGFIVVNGTEWTKIRNLSTMFGTNLFVLGLPRSNAGNETAQSQFVRRFAQRLIREIPGARIKFQDESLTSVVAEERLKTRKKKYDKGEIDAEAATIILQDFLESLGAPKANNAPVAEPENTTEEEAMIEMEAEDGKKKRSSWLRIVSIIAILVILGLIAVAVALYMREKRIEERQAWYREQEEKMIATTFDFTIKPGETIMDIKKNLLAVDRNGVDLEGERIPNFTEEEIDKAFSASYDFEMLKGRPSNATLEGFLYPETHNYYSYNTVEEVLTKFLSGMQEKVDELDLAAKYQEKGLSLYEGIVLASVVQKEANPADQPTVAQVFLTRISYGMALGSDVTVSYALDLIDPERTTYNNNYDALKVDSCYNTRLYAGLPCGAISNPGLSALEAVANPTDTTYLYFLTGDDGLMYYSYTEAEHNQNIYAHCQVLCNVSL